ncbi:UPF0643 protein [Escovopsis weberi]|uniref:UPF0643 protein n=1 Tax=Escovopsis weberi TaxID=150374 RepID=A0A0M9VU78_ESCWE|nr:UPF0643 protein [Escovopsis weberi]
MAAQGAAARFAGVPLLENDPNSRQDTLRLASLDTDRFLVQSPYTEQEHLLDLETLDHETALFSKALRLLRPIRDDYATATYSNSFNWGEVLDEAKRLCRESGEAFGEKSFYIVAFRSQVKPSADSAYLGDLDKAAHAEAVASGGFLRYWFGKPDSHGRNLATCIWRSRGDALAGARGPAHRKAGMAGREMYAFWKIDQHRLVIRENVDDWKITPM